MKTSGAGPPSDEHFSIGDAARLSGISPETIRIWERRYGRPKPVRLRSGHRRYTGEQVRWLRRVAEALALGHRPSAVVELDEEAIARLLDRPLPGISDTPEIERMLELAREFHGTELRTLMRRGWTKLGVRRYVSSVVMPALERAGQAWADGDLDVRHEHFLSEVIEDELRVQRASLTESSDGPRIIFATLGGEEHGLGIQVAALFALLAGARPRIVGVNLPEEEIARAAFELDARVVAIGVSLATGGIETDRRLADLRGLLPEGVRLVVGGKGARRGRRGPRKVDYVADLDEFETWIRELALLRTR